MRDENKTSPIYRNNSKVKEAILCLRDITDQTSYAAEQKKLREELQLEKQKVTDILDSITAAFFALNDQWKIIYVNKTALQYFNKSEQECIGQDFRCLKPEIKGSIYDEYFREAMTQKAPRHFEAKGVLEDRWFEVHVYPSADGISVYCNDITNRKQMENALQYLAAIVENSTNAIYSTDLKGLIKSWNPSAQRIFGYSFLEIEGQSASILYPPDMLSQYDMFLKKINYGECIIRPEIPHVRKDGSIIYVSISKSPIKNEKGEIIGISSIVEDISRRIEMEKEMLRLNRLRSAGELASRMNVKLLELDRLKDEFLANTSHELRTPLHGIINITKAAIESGQLNQIQQQNLQIVVASAQHLHNLINDILDMSSLQQSAIKLARRPVDIRTMTETVIFVLKHLRGNKKIEFINSIPRELSPVYADVERLRQVLFNLLGNALKFTTKGQIVVGAVKRNDSLEIWVEDTGCGVPEDKLEEIFKSFYQVNASESKEIYGTGLGLSITKILIELHEGTIWVNSTIGKGSRFTFTLPICFESNETIHLESSNDVHNKAAAEDAAMKPVYRSLISDNKRKYSILAADDDVASLTALFNILDNEGYYVKALNSGEDVLQELQKCPEYNLVILDIMMPKLSGYEVLKRIRKRFHAIDMPVLLLTAKARPDDLQAGFDAGANDYLTKPFEALELKARVKTLVQLKESVSELVAKELSFLQAQIKPHFLYNTLNVITALCNKAPLRAKELLYDFSDYLRGSFDFENLNGMTPLSTELSTIQAYLSIEMERFENKLRVEYDIDETLDISVPLLTIQPLVENAIRHGILKKAKGGTLKLSIKNRDKYVIIKVQDDGIGIPPDKLADLLNSKISQVGVGLKNIQRRLMLSYGEGLDIQSEENQGTIITMKIPNSTIN
ncbi:PAS domain S-box [Desulfosporosinus acidiphilus SJ4]|uniref:Stage 0 sporulation protein A homolog n=1 Tax=Desulfosporosinus acidiphilus (strain DSM 22704 / JCM 16185 / SJ4) TaxID=646529 RepID=I4D707_DESAJ|nr:ATP-binding protein [Desulfosporosinus acidiphilus]AFM41581.1 PAS domain S-box [Desulfosporosinus acidiphilus SJ4]